MTIFNLNRGALACALALAAMQPAWAKVTPHEAEKLGNELTCLGGEKAGNKDGTIPPFSGKWLGVPSGVNYKGPGTHWPDPYANEKPLFSITAQNMDQYAARLSDGQIALLKKYPATFRIPVYPSHRDFRTPGYTCTVAKDNALKAVIAEGEEGVVSTAGAIPFPIPKSGIELLWNANNMYTSEWTNSVIFDQAVVPASGAIAWGRTDFKCLAPKNDPKVHRSTNDTDPVYGGVAAWCLVETLLPERNKGEIILSRESYDYKKNPRAAYSYNPGTRRVRQLPAFGFDMPQGVGGGRTIDDDHLFNGTPQRYSWKIVGKREMYIPWNAYRLNDPKVKYADLLKTKGHINPDQMRYELQRVWVLEGTLKEGYRHLYAKRVIYLNEDDWLPVMSDQYDGRGQLWREAMLNWFYAYEAQVYTAGVAVHHDLMSGGYLADRLLNEQAKASSLNQGELKPDMFTPDALRRLGH